MMPSPAETSAYSTKPSFIDDRFISQLSLDGSAGMSSNGGSLFHSLAAVKFCPARYVIGTKTSGSTIFSIIDNAAKNRNLRWILRLDKAHKGANYAHININKRLTGVEDPHVPIPDGALTAGSAVTNAVKYGGYALLAVSAAISAVSIGKAVYADVEEKKSVGKRTIKTSASTAAGWAGGFGGALGGNSIGATVGGAVGTLFGGVGAVPGAAIGGIVGGLLGGVGGGVGSTFAAEAITDKAFEIHRLGMRGFIIKIDGKHLCILPNVAYKSNKKEVAKEDKKEKISDEEKAAIEAAKKDQLLQEWMEIIKQIVTIAMAKSQVFTFSYERNILAANDTYSNFVTQIIISDDTTFTAKNCDIFIAKHDNPSDAFLNKICDLEEFKQSKLLLSAADTKEILLKDMICFLTKYLPPINEDVNSNDQVSIENSETPDSNAENSADNSDSADKLLGEDNESSEGKPEEDLQFKTPIFDITHEAVCMDDTGHVLFWLNPQQGVRDAAILLEKNILSLEIISLFS